MCFTRQAKPSRFVQSNFMHCALLGELKVKGWKNYANSSAIGSWLPSRSATDGEKGGPRAIFNRKPYSSCRLIYFLTTSAAKKRAAVADVDSVMKLFMEHLHLSSSHAACGTR
jgi:hypothetical protein